MRVLVLAVLATSSLAASTAVAHADEDQQPMVKFADRWPSLPTDDHYLTLEDRITDHLTDYSNSFGAHVQDRLHVFGFQLDGRARRAHVHVGGGDHYLTFGVDGDVDFADGMARVHAQLALGIAGHEIHVDVPDFEMVPESYNGDRYVEVRVPLLERRW